MQQKARYTKGRLAELAELTESAGTRVTKARKKNTTHTEKVTKTRQNDEDHTRGIMPETSRGGRGNLPLHKGRTCIGAHRHRQTDRHTDGGGNETTQVKHIRAGRTIRERWESWRGMGENATAGLSK